MQITAFGTKGCVVRGRESYTAEQGSNYEPGVSAETVGSKSLFLGVVTLPPGRRTKAHTHERHETALYMMSGEPLDVYTGSNLEHHDLVRPGDYLFIPMNVLHVAVNNTGVPAVFMASRNEATVNESVVLDPDMDAIVP
jgi:uncharacterized RmlC-like cupin family protein